MINKYVLPLRNEESIIASSENKSKYLRAVGVPHKRFIYENLDFGITLESEHFMTGIGIYFMSTEALMPKYFVYL